MKRKRLSAILGCILALTILAGFLLPLANAADVTIEFLNPFGRIEPLDNQPLAERTPWAVDASGHLTEKKVILRVTYSGSHGPDALVMHLIDQYGKYGQYYPDAGIIFVTSSLGGNWGPKTEQNYNVNWVNPTGGAGSPTYFSTNYTSSVTGGNWVDQYSSGSGTYAGPIDVAILGTAD